mmetsp:Transcript_30841/g.51034  ORF Transcript_30841/g.51034 Transcript_30841/m.51034 type:complete len:91 (+) Transcript_30841:158-430(+)
MAKPHRGRLEQTAEGVGVGAEARVAGLLELSPRGVNADAAFTAALRLDAFDWGVADQVHTPHWGVYLWCMCSTGELAEFARNAAVSSGGT